MEIITAMRIAIEVARLGSFAAAGRELRLSAPSVSRIVAELEADLGVRLFNRTTRQLSLTEAGLEFVQKSSGILEELDNMRSAVRERHDTPRGQLRVSCVTAFGNECLAPALP
ncbi:MAG: LysR family transcriptional regulator, partial [Mesorhizobium sp.]